MQALLINTFDVQGGAARAANRLHKALNANNANSRMLVLHKKSFDQSVFEINPYQPGSEINYQYILKHLVQSNYLDSSRTEVSNTLFSFAYPGYDISSNPLFHSTDVINLHWISFFQSPATIQKLMKLGKPIVWTLHDMSPFTGGCHYAAGCDGFTRDCLDCPQLSNDPYSLPNAILKDKLELFADFPLTIVTPSKWLADCARKSTLFRNCRIEVIPNCIETDIYTPVSKNEAKTALGINPQRIVLMFGADSSNEKRKGFAELENALALARANPLFEVMVAKGEITILSLGPLNADVAKLGLQVKALGHVNDDSLISRAYSAADIFILPSLEDNLPNMMLEAMACGTPVLAFNIGGIPDVVIDEVNGVLVTAGNVKALSERLVELVSDKALRERLGAEAASILHEAYTPKIQAGHYKALFEDLLSSSVRSSWAAQYESEMHGNADEFDMECGPGFEVIRHKILLDVLLKAIPEICQVNSPVAPHRLQDLEIALQESQLRIQALQSSLSWRLTKPLRWLGDMMRR